MFRKGAAVARDVRRSTLVEIAADTGARIASLLRQHGSEVARRLGFGVVDLLIADLHSPWAEELLRGTMEVANEVGTSVIVTTVHTPQEFADWLGRATARGTDGALCVLPLPGSRELHRRAAARIPLVAIDPPVEPGDAIRSVGTTNCLGGMTATRHLIELGHRRIAIIGGPPGLWSSQARLDGYRAALQAAGLDVDESLIRRDDFSLSSGRAQARELLSLPQPPTAVVAGNDGQAFGVLQALGERGLRAPDDLSVVGFDDVPVASWSTPALTTVRQPLAAMAATAFRMLRSDPATAVGEPHHIELATTLVIRESTGPPRR